MKMVKNIAILALAGSFMFAGVSFHMANNYNELDGTEGPTVGTSYGASWSLNDNTSVGFDSALGMLMTFGVGNATLRMGWNSTTVAGEEDGDPREDGDPPRTGQIGSSFGHHQSPRRRRRRNPDSEEAQHRLR